MLVGVIGLAAIKIVPMYISNMRLSKDLDGISEDLSGKEVTAQSIQYALAKRFSVDDVTLPKDAIKVAQSKNGYSVRIQYENRAPYMGDIWLPDRFRQAGRDQKVTSRADWAEKHLRYSFRDPALLERALTHRSASRDNNERLEYLGDSFLSFVTAHRLYDRRPLDDEGDLSRARAALVRQTTLASIGQRLQLDGQVILGAGELRSGGAQRVAMLADAVEALIGAVLLDGGARPQRKH